MWETHAKIDLKPDTQAIEEWLAQQLAISLATDPNSVPMPLKSMGDGWQSMIRLAALEALTEYPDLVRERVVLLLEEPETHLHPHLRRKIRRVLGAGLRRRDGLSSSRRTHPNWCHSTRTKS